MLSVKRPPGSSVPENAFEPPVLAFPKLTWIVPVPGVLFALRTVNVTVNGTPMFTRDGPLYVTKLPSASVREGTTGGETVGTGVRTGARTGACVGACVGTGVPPGACVGAGVASTAVAVGSAETATDAPGFTLTPGATVGAGLALGELC